MSTEQQQYPGFPEAWGIAYDHTPEAPFQFIENLDGWDIVVVPATQGHPPWVLATKTHTVESDYWCGIRGGNTFASNARGPRQARIPERVTTLMDKLSALIG